MIVSRNLKSTFLVTRFLADSKVPTIPQLPYSPDMALPNFFLFPRPKTPMKGHYSGTVGIVKEACTKVLMDIPEKAYHDAFNAWKSLNVLYRSNRYTDITFGKTM